jgi:AcrR family transcriptional regulator
VRILAAAERLFAEHGVGKVSMDQVAAEAGVGKGTLFRRFGDKAGLAASLLGEREKELQAEILTGKPPLGPGATPRERLKAFLHAYADLLDTHLDLVHLSETASPGARYRVGAYRLWRTHVAHLVRQANPEADADFLAQAILASVAADQRKATKDEFPAERFKRGLDTLADKLTH